MPNPTLERMRSLHQRYSAGQIRLRVPYHHCRSKRVLQSIRFILEPASCMYPFFSLSTFSFLSPSYWPFYTPIIQCSRLKWFFASPLWRDLRSWSWKNHPPEILYTHFSIIERNLSILSPLIERNLSILSAFPCRFYIFFLCLFFIQTDT